MKLSFTKWHGCGNDFILLHKNIDAVQDFGILAKKLCDRHYGIGADGILILEESEKADLKMEIVNADGTYAQMCGNGIRCLAKYAYEEKIIKKDTFFIETAAGILTTKLMLQADGTVKNICVDMGEPILEGEKIPILGYASARVIAESLEVGKDTYKITCVSMGNPHCVLFVSDAENFNIREIGPVIEKHHIFPEKTNVEFAQIISQDVVRMRVFERGAGVTLACGTGAAATLVAGVLNKLINRKVQMILDGGKLTLEWQANNHIYMTGPAERVFQGEIDF